ncbi:MAG: NADP(H)-dependent aldo-keto reductase [Sneathiellaceae bacterium]
MDRRPLGRTGIEVSAYCLGTMTWGEQNDEAEAHRQLDLALDRGVDFVDTAEMYPVPPRAETQGRTESHIGSWLAARGGRDRIVLASKVAGRSPMSWMRDPAAGLAESRLDRQQITYALEQSLRRLRTDYLDLYQVHWPERSTNFFGKLGYAPEERPDCVPIAETLEVLGDLVRAGKVRAVGVSNETPWGMLDYLRAADAGRGPRIASIQNPYNLLNRTFEIGLAEIAMREQAGLLAYSPLAMGVLSGKYLNGAKPAGARLTLFDRFQRYATPEAVLPVARYVHLAKDNGLDPAQMALAYVASRPFVTSTILGATSIEQLEADLGAADLKLDMEVLELIETIHTEQPNPCP